MKRDKTAHWNELLTELKANRNDRVPKVREVEERIIEEMEGIYHSLTEEAREGLERPEPPRYRDTPMDLIALNDRGQLIGFEDEEDW